VFFFLGGGLGLGSGWGPSGWSPLGVGFVVFVCGVSLGFFWVFWGGVTLFYFKFLLRWFITQLASIRQLMVGPRLG